MSRRELSDALLGVREAVYRYAALLGLPAYKVEGLVEEIHERLVVGVLMVDDEPEREDW